LAAVLIDTTPATTPEGKKPMATATDTKPAKPYREFPLFAHANGQWAKKIKGKQWSFGVWADPESALAKYLDQVDEIQAGRDPRRTGVVRVSSNELTVADLCNLFLERQRQRADAGKITNRHFSDCLKSCRRLVAHFGKFMRATSMTAKDFQAYQAAFPPSWGTSMIGGEVQRTRSSFKWAFEADLIPHVPNFGPDFRKPNKSEARREKQQRERKRGGKLDFTAAEVNAMLEQSKGWLRACILLGINGGMGNADCGRLATDFYSVTDDWYDLPREKTGISRRFRVWTETAEAIHAAMMQRPIPKDDAHDLLCFLTSHGMPIWWQGTKPDGTVFLCDNVGKAFARLTTKCGIDKDGRGFYSLRRTFETVAGNTKDQVAVDLVMGHADDSMAAVYRQGIDDQRLIDVSQHVHKWLFGK